MDRVSAVVVTAWPNTGDQPPTQDRGTLSRLWDNISDCQVTAGVTVRPWSSKLADRQTILSVSGASKCGSVGTIVSNQRDSTLEAKHIVQALLLPLHISVMLFYVLFKTSVIHIPTILV